MGFGLLLVGYFTATVMSLNVCGGAFALIGYILVFFASKKLLQYNHSFLYLLYASAVMILLSSVLAVYDVSSLMHRYLLIPTQPISDATADIFLNFKMFLDLGFTAVLCFSIKSIANETGAGKIVYASVRNFVFYCVFFVLQGIVWISTISNIAFLKELVVMTALPVWVVIIKLICLIFICLMLFSCYSRICDVSDVDMPQKPSRFGFVNRHREERERRHQEYLEQAQQRAEQKRNKK